MRDGREIAVIKSYAELIEALRARADELEITRETIDHAAGFLGGYAGKLLARTPIRTLGRVSLGPMLQVLGMSILLIEDLSAIKKINSRITRRLRPRSDASGAMPTGKSKRHRSVFKGNSEWGRLMAARRVLLQTNRQRSRSASKAARARWHQARAAAGAI
jgi:hypothetical protein